MNKYKKPIKPEYQVWRNRIEGQIKHAMNEHPEWFNLRTQEIKDRAIRSIAKRVIGEIVAGTGSGDNKTVCASVSAFSLKRFIVELPTAINKAVGGIAAATRFSSKNNRKI